MKKFKLFILVVWYSVLRLWKKTARNLKSGKTLHLHNQFYVSSNFRTKNILLGPQKYIFVGVVALIAIAVLVRFIPNLYPKNSVSEGIVGIYTTKNLPPQVINLISKPLVTVDQSGNPQPELADRWEANNEATVYKFTLKNNLYWDDATKLKSSDIKFNIPDVNVEYPDDNTIIFKLADSFAPFPALLTSPIIKHNTLVGVGTYKVGGIETSHGVVTKMTLRPNQQKKDGNHTLPVVSIRFYPDEKIAQTAFKLGEVDSLVGINERTQITGNSSVREKGVTTYNKLTAVYFNTKDPILSDKNMRKALNTSIPEIITEQVAKTSIPSRSWAFNNTLKIVHGDPVSAKSYLSKVENGKDSTIILTTTPALATIGEKVIQAWKSIGINAVLRVESGVPQNFQALLISENIPADPDQYTLWHSTQDQTNISHYSSPRVDKDLEDGRKTSDQEKRKELYMDMQKVLHDDSPAAFLYFPKLNVIYRGRIEDSLNKVLGFQIK